MEGDHDEPLGDFESKNSFCFQEEVEVQENIPENEWITKIKSFFNDLGIFNEQKLQENLDHYMEDTEKFYSLNHLVQNEIDSPKQRCELRKCEKYLENLDEIMKDWSNKLREVQKNSSSFVNSLQSFRTSLEQNINIFKENNEIYFILNVFNEFFKKAISDIDSTTTNIKICFE